MGQYFSKQYLGYNIYVRLYSDYNIVVPHPPLLMRAHLCLPF